MLFKSIIFQMKIVNTTTTNILGKSTVSWSIEA